MGTEGTLRRKRQFPIVDRWAKVPTPIELHRFAKSAGLLLRYDLSFGEYKDPYTHSKAHLLDDTHARTEDPSGSLGLRERVLTWLDAEEYASPENILIAASANQCVFICLLALGSPGSSVLLAPACRPEYHFLTETAGMRAETITVKYASERCLLPSAEDILDSFRRVENAKLLLIDSPCNPTAQEYSKAELEVILEICNDFNAYLILDRRFWRMSFSSEQYFDPQAKHLPWLIQIDSASSGFANAGGLRVAWCLAPPDVSEALAIVQTHLGGSASTPSQDAVRQRMAQYTLEEHTPLLRLRDIWLAHTEGTPLVRPFPIMATCFAFWDVSELLEYLTVKNHPVQTSLDLAEYLLEQHGILCVPGSVFGVEGHLRFSFSQSEENLIDAASCLKNAIIELSS